MACGTAVYASITWPVALDGACPLQLLVEGRVVRRSGNVTVISVRKYEFRTSRRLAQPEQTRADALKKKMGALFSDAGAVPQRTAANL